MDDRPIVVFDTSAINQLADDPDCADLLRRIYIRFHVRLSATAVGELIATPEAQRRNRLVALCKRLLRSGDCIHNAYHLLQMLICEFEGSDDFDWQQVDVRFQEAEDVLRSGGSINDSESQSVREENREAKGRFEEFYKRFKLLYGQAFAQPGAERPANLSESVDRLRKSGSFAKMASVLYVYISGRDPRGDSHTAPEVEKLLRFLPPLHAYVLGLCAARYSRNLKPSSSPSMRAGALDTPMATCLPYCHVFVTNDRGMENCFKEIRSIAEMPVEVLSYDCFRRRLT